MNYKMKDQRGSVTVEAAIVLPLLISAILTIGMFCKVFYVQEIIHHVITETAYELSAVSYITYVGGLEDIKKDLDSGVEKHEDFSSVTDLEEMGKWIMANGYDRGKAELGNGIIKQLVKKKLAPNNPSAIDKRLKQLNIVEGLAGMDFSKSSYLLQGQDIEIVVTYRMELPLPIKFIKEIPIRQQVKVRAWIKGSLPTDFLGGEEKPYHELIDEVIEAGFDVWKLSVYNRGREIKKILGSNLHENYPIIDALKDQEVVSIRSHDLRLPSNEGRGLYNQLKADLRELHKFTEKTYKGVTIGKKDYQGKVLNIVIPDVELTEEQIKSIRDAKIYGAERNIRIKVTVVK